LAIYPQRACCLSLWYNSSTVPDPSSQGSLRLFRLSGIEVFLHWSWFVVAVYEIQQRDGGRYSSIKWNILEYLGLFAIVLLHEFGHALACRQVGGRANRIVLWPLGGVAYVDPPPRPGATLWSIAAGPLVNVALVPVILGLGYVSRQAGWYQLAPDLHTLLKRIFLIDIWLLAFNILPIYPLDGGQILRSLLWFVFGRARSLMVAASIGFVGVIGFVGLAVCLVRRHRCLPAAELLERTQAGARFADDCQAPTSRRLSLPPLQVQASPGRFLDLRPMPACIRHVSNRRGLPCVRHTIRCDPLPGLWLGIPDGPLGRGQPDAYEPVGTGHGEGSRHSNRCGSPRAVA